MRIAYLTTSLQVGGAERVLYDVATRLDRTRFDPSVICLQPTGPIGEAFQLRGVPVTALGMKTLFDAVAFPRLVRLLRDLRPDLLHAHLSHANLLGRFAARLAGVPRVVCSVHIMDLEHPWHVWLDGATIGFVDAEVCVTESVRAFTRDVAGVPEARLLTIENGIDLAAVDAAPPTPREDVGVPGTPFLLSVGRLRAQKGIDVAIRAAALLLRRRRRFRWVVAGEGKERPALEALVRELRVEDVFSLAGLRPDAIGLTKSCDLLVLPSRWEGMGLVLLDALASGRPVVATDIGGVRDVITHEEHGLLVPPEDPVALADAIERMLDDPALARATAERGRVMVRGRFTVDRMVRAHEELYESFRNPRIASLT